MYVLVKKGCIDILECGTAGKCIYGVLQNMIIF